MVKTAREGVSVLVVDQNKVYAGFVKEMLETALTNPVIEIAVNIWELRRRLANRKYNLVIVDLAAALDEEEMSAELSTASEDSTIITWTAIGKHKCLMSCDSTAIRKPRSVEELREVMGSLVTKSLV